MTDKAARAAAFRKAFTPLPGKKHTLSDEQWSIVMHGDGPLWVIAGPGSGKTDCLTLRAIWLLYVEGLDGRSIVTTTFTEKAALQLRRRIERYVIHLAGTDADLAKRLESEVVSLRLGTLHGLCRNIMVEYNAQGMADKDILDATRQRMLISAHVDAAGPGVSTDHKEIWQGWPEQFEGWTAGWKRDYDSHPNSWSRTRGLATLFDRLVEYRVDEARLAQQPGGKELLAAHIDYQAVLDNASLVDFAGLQAAFLRFLASQEGRSFIHGDIAEGEPGISHVLVDEYQDTNPIQEEIYMRLASRAPHNLTVVGDDDQAMYRFRGGSVEAIVNFDTACKWHFKVDPTPKALAINYRSPSSIVDFCQDYIGGFSEMLRAGARAPNKKRIVASNPKDRHPAVFHILSKKREDAAIQVTAIVRHLLATGQARTPGDFAVLVHSVNAGGETGAVSRLARELAAAGIAVYNPGGKGILDDDRVTQMLGALMECLDPDGNHLVGLKSTELRDEAFRWRSTYAALARKVEGASLRAFVQSTQQNLAKRCKKSPVVPRV